MLELTLDKPMDLQIRAAETKSISKITVKRIVKLPDEKKIMVMTAELPKFIVVYADKEYGDYTDQQIMDQVAKLAVSGFTFSN